MSILETLPALFVTVFIAGLSGAMMPGPLTTLTLAHAGRLGARAGPLATLGHAVVKEPLVAGMLWGWTVR